jgi:hypothetical protein
VPKGDTVVYVGEYVEPELWWEVWEWTVSLCEIIYILRLRNQLG